MTILKYLDKLYYLCPQKNILWRVIRYCVKLLTNLYVRYLMPIKCRYNPVNEDTLIISLTSFPARIKDVWMTCATLLNQDVENIHVVLWLSREQFSMEFDSLPKKLLRLMDKGLDIRFVEDDLRPHKKYFYALKAFSENDIVTVDDDILYNPLLISTLLTCHHKHTDCVICNRGVNLCHKSYKSWYSNKIYDEERTDIMPTGIGGVFYPAHIFDGTPIHDVDAIKSTCLYGDDLWLNFMTRFNGHKVVQTGFITGLITIFSSQKSALCKENVGEDRNDKQIRLLSKWAEKELGCNYYVNII